MTAPMPAGLTVVWVFFNISVNFKLLVGSIRTASGRVLVLPFDLSVCVTITEGGSSDFFLSGCCCFFLLFFLDLCVVKPSYDRTLTDRSPLLLLPMTWKVVAGRERAAFSVTFLFQAGFSGSSLILKNVKTRFAFSSSRIQVSAIASLMSLKTFFCFVMACVIPERMA